MSLQRRWRSTTSAWTTRRTKCACCCARYRQLRPNQEDNFGLLASASLVALWDRLTKVLATMAVGIVSVFMVVGGVVIMNIMLAVVTERTYEIGIRKAVGARQGDILRQFLIESSLLSATGGLMGVVLAWLLTVVVRAATPMPMAVPPSAVVVGVGLSGAGRPVLRRVSGAAGGQAGPDSRAEVGTMTLSEIRSPAPWRWPRCASTRRAAC